MTTGTLGSTRTTVSGIGGGSPAVNGNAATSVVGFYGTTPVAQAATITALSGTIVSTGAFGYATSAEFLAVQTAVNSILTALKNIGIVAT